VGGFFFVSVWLSFTTLVFGLEGQWIYQRTDILSL